jgi:hypothetical protein
MKCLLPVSDNETQSRANKTTELLESARTKKRKRNDNTREEGCIRKRDEEQNKSDFRIPAFLLFLNHI